MSLDTPQLTIIKDRKIKEGEMEWREGSTLQNSIAEYESNDKSPLLENCLVQESEIGRKQSRVK